MRISSQMQIKSFINMQNSETYKNYFKNKKDDVKSSDSKEASDSKETSKEVKDSKELKHITSNVIVEKKDDTYVLSKIDEDNNKTELSEVKAKSKSGMMLSKYFTDDKSSELNSKLNQVNNTIRSMSLSNYI